MKNKFVLALACSMLLLTWSSCQKNDNNALKDIDGNTYETVIIGKQTWMARNLNVARYRNGDSIPEIKDRDEWATTTKGAWCYFQNDSSNAIIYGRIYNWYAVNDPRGLAPEGWHVPNDPEWLTMTNSLGGELVAGGAMKLPGTLQSGTGLWAGPNTSATNSSGFSALPAGYREFNGDFANDEFATQSAFWWSSTLVADNPNGPGPSFTAFYNGAQLIHIVGFPSNNGFSVRCVKD